MPFVSKFPSNGFKERMGLLTKDAVGGSYKGSKVTALLLASLEIVTLLLRLLGSKNFLMVLGVVGLGIEVDNSDINDAVGGRRVSSTKEEITTAGGGGGELWEQSQPKGVEVLEGATGERSWAHG